MFGRKKKAKEFDHKKLMQEIYDCYIDLEEKYKYKRDIPSLIKTSWRLGRAFGKLQYQEYYGNMIIRMYNDR